MSTTNVPTSSTSAEDWFVGDVPGGDVPFSQLFPGDAPTIAVQPAQAQPVTQQGTPSQPAPQVQPAPSSFEKISTATGSVYDSRDAVVKGIEDKDRLIEKMRQEMILKLGYDPARDRAVNINQPQNPAQPANYLQDAAKYVDDLKTALEAGKADAYRDAQAKLVFDILQPLAPVITDLARQRAVENVSGQYQDFPTFRRSDEFKTVLDENEVLKDAIQAAENDYRLHAQLPGLYKLAYQAAQGRKVPDLLRDAAKQSVAAQPQTQPRPTMSPNQVTPPAPSVQTLPDLSTSAGRKEIIERFKGQGYDNITF